MFWHKTFENMAKNPLQIYLLKCEWVVRVKTTWGENVKRMRTITIRKYVI